MTDEQHMPHIESALHWLAILQDHAVSQQDRHAFQAWLSADPAHALAWQRAQYVWQRAGILAPVLRRPATPTRRRWLQGAAAAGVGLAAGGYVLSAPGLLADYRTAVAEHRQIGLSDGSQVELGSDSALSVHFDAARRSVTLDRGEAYFEVTADAGRPFIVQAAGGQTRALGTAFNIKMAGDMVVVTVAAHAVVVDAPNDERIHITTGQQIRYGSRGLSELVTADLPSVLGWRQNRLVFEDAPLGEVVADLERYSPGRLVITDDALRNLPVTAIFDAGQATAAIDTIAKTLPIRLQRFGRLLTVISPAG